MRKLTVFNSISVDGFFTDAEGDMSWAYQGEDDPEWRSFVKGNASGGGTLVFGRITYEMMAGFWPTPMAAQMNPVVAEQMNRREKIVFSKTLNEAEWNNTALIKGDLITEIRRLKDSTGGDLVILGSGSLVSQLAQAKLIDEFQLALVPVVLGAGRTLFEGVKEGFSLKLLSSRTFANGKTFLRYQPDL